MRGRRLRQRTLLLWYTLTGGEEATVPQDFISQIVPHSAYPEGMLTVLCDPLLPPAALWPVAPGGVRTHGGERGQLSVQAAAPADAACPPSTSSTDVTFRNAARYRQTRLRFVRDWQ